MTDKKKYERWYFTARWKKQRARQLNKAPLCIMCSEQGILTLATVANHIKAHKGDAVLFWDPDNLNSLCKVHHDSTQQRFEKSGIKVMAFDDEGWPIE